MFDALKNDAAGLAILREWLGEDGVPVPVDDATRRAQVCLQCPENRAPRWWGSAKGAIARAIRRHLEIKHRIGLVADENRLGMCHACGCCLPLKVFVPIKHIEAHTDLDAWSKFPSFCWIRREAHK